MIFSQNLTYHPEAEKFLSKINWSLKKSVESAAEQIRNCLETNEQSEALSFAAQQMLMFVQSMTNSKHLCVIAIHKLERHQAARQFWPRQKQGLFASPRIPAEHCFDPTGLESPSGQFCFEKATLGLIVCLALPGSARDGGWAGAILFT